MQVPGTPPSPSQTRYQLFEEIARGGMARVHVGRALGAAGFARTVAVKRLHRSHGDDPELVAMLLDEARLVARVRHPNVVPIVDMVDQDGELLLAMEYVHGETLARLARGCPGGRLPPAVAAAAVAGALHGLHAAHEAKDERGEPLDLVHRDVSPQNVMVGTDGVARVLDFGIAKAAHRSQVTRQGHIKGKYSYMAPEQIRRGAVDRRTDLFAAAAVLWELLTGRQLFGADNPAAVMTAVLSRPVEPPSAVVEGLPPALDALVLKGLERDPDARFSSAREMAVALERAIDCASAVEVGAWVEATAAKALTTRAQLIARAELATSPGGAAPADGRPPPPGAPPASPASARPADPGLPFSASRGAPAGPPRGAMPSGPPSAPAPSLPGTAPALALSAPPRVRSSRFRPMALAPIAAGAVATFALVAWGPPTAVFDLAPRATQASAVDPASKVFNPPLPAASGPAATPAPSAAAAADAATPAAAVADASTTAAAAAAPAPEAPKSAKPAPSAPTPPARPPARPAAPPRRASSGPEATADSSCSPPYRIEDGIRIPKPHCL